MGSVFEGLLYSQDKIYYQPFPFPAAVIQMEKKEQKRTVELVNSFETIWNNVSGRSFKLQTEELSTPFVVKALMAKRRGFSILEEVLVFLKNDGNGKLKECSRCYSEDWGCYFNHLGRDGQRIGMYCKAVDLMGP